MAYETYGSNGSYGTNGTYGTYMTYEVCGFDGGGEEWFIAFCLLFCPFYPLTLISIFTSLFSILNSYLLFIISYFSILNSSLRIPVRG